MSDRPVKKFEPDPVPEQLTREQLKGMSPDEINRARRGGHLRDLLAGKKPEPPAPPAPAPDPTTQRVAELLRKGQKQ
jgi:hypothetical protein